MPWTGPERRKHADDHDNIIALIEILDSHVKNFNTHITDDKTSFDSLSKKIDSLSKYIYIGVGIIVSLDALPKIVETVKVVVAH